MLKEVCPDIFTQESEINIFPIKLPVRETLVKLNHGLVLISPIASVREDFEEGGNVTEIVSPSLVHHLALKKAKELFPSAKVWGVSGLEKKVGHNIVDQYFFKDSWPYGEELKVYSIDGMPSMKEVVFYHIKSKTLIVTDLCFNLQSVNGFFSWLSSNLFGTFKKFTVSKLFMTQVKDRNAFTLSILEILKLDFDRIIMAHGEILHTQAKSKIEAALKMRKIIN